MSKAENTRRVETVDSDDKEVVLIVKRPGAVEINESNAAGVRAGNVAIKAGASTRQGLEDHMMETGVWDDSKASDLKKLAKKLRDGERQLARGAMDARGKKFSKKQAVALCKNMATWRGDQMELLSRQRELDEFTVQGQQENAKFDVLVSLCVFHEDQKKVFEDLDDYHSKSLQPYSIAAAQELASLMYGLDADYTKKYAENKFLVKHKLVDEDLNYINAGGDKVDDEGRLVNDDGRFVDKKGEFLDIDGNRIDEEGDPVEEYVPFSDE